MKFNVGDKVRIKENLNECEFGCNSYMRNFIGKKATVMNIFRDNILLDIDGQMWYWSENVLELIKENNNINVKIEEGNKVNESDLKDSDIEPIDIRVGEESVENDPVNPFMREYKKIVMDTMELCIAKNKDYGSSVQDTYERFGDVSYLVRITDKYNRICYLLQNGKAEVEDESITDTIVDLANYCFLWASSRNLKVEDKNNE